MNTFLTEPPERFQAHNNFGFFKSFVTCYRRRLKIIVHSITSPHVIYRFLRP